MICVFVHTWIWLESVLECVIVCYAVLDISRWLQSQLPFPFQMFAALKIVTALKMTGRCNVSVINP
jgi:hypothetical protein